MSFERIARRLQEKGRSRHAGGYRWLLEHYEAMIQVMTTIGPSWNAIAEEAANAGVRGVHQQVITGDSLRRTWKRVCRDVQRRAAAGEAVKAPQEKPVRPLPVDWTPPLADPPSAQSNSAPPAIPTTAQYRPEDDPTLPEEVRRKLRALAQDFKHRDRHLHHPTREELRHE
jgi:hypothetical protein